MWARGVLEALPDLQDLVHADSAVLEVGYGDGLLSCYVCRKLGWRLTGLDASRDAQLLAEHHAERFGLGERVEFRSCPPEQTRQHRGQYDAVFIKTVLYNAPDLPEYARWLDWILAILRPGGILVNFETGRGNALVRGYRRLRRRRYADLCLYTREVEALYDARFDIIHRRYYGGWSQFLAPLPPLYSLAARLEELGPRHADNSFIVSIIARHPG